MDIKAQDVKSGDIKSPNRVLDKLVGKKESFTILYNGEGESECDSIESVFSLIDEDFNKNLIEIELKRLEPNLRDVLRAKYISTGIINSTSLTSEYIYKLSEYSYITFEDSKCKKKAIEKGYTLSDIEDCFKDHYTVLKWGVLQAKVSIDTDNKELILFDCLREDIPLNSEELKSVSHILSERYLQEHLTNKMNIQDIIKNSNSREELIEKLEEYNISTK